MSATPSHKPLDVARLREAHLEALRGLLPRLKAHADDLEHQNKTEPSHLVQMIESIPVLVEMPLTKIARWTGYIQGVMAARGWLSIDEERERTRPIFAIERGEISPRDRLTASGLPTWLPDGIELAACLCDDLAFCQRTAASGGNSDDPSWERANTYERAAEEIRKLPHRSAAFINAIMSRSRP